MAIMDIDGNGLLQTGADAFLVVRYILGFKGDNLIADVVGPGATRTTAAQIEGYLDYIYPRLDVDGNGEVTLADGMMILLYMAGFRDEALVEWGSNDIYMVEPGARRVTADEIEEYIATLLV